MRASIILCSAALSLFIGDTPSSAWGQTSSASGAIGAGAFDGNATVSLDVGVDVAGERYAMGLGGRLNWLLSGGFRSADWDERSEWANIVRYLTYARDHDNAAVTLAIGQLGGVSLGDGALIDNYSAGLNLDHRHQGIHVGVQASRFAVEAVLDDLIAPRIAGVRGEFRVPRATRTLSLGASTVADFQAPEHDDTGVMEDTTVPMLAAHGRIALNTPDRRISGAVYADAVFISTIASGLHIGLSGESMVSESTTVSLRGELRVGSDSYIPGWIGPLYEIQRRVMRTHDDSMAGFDSQLDIARAGELGGLGGLIASRLRMPTIGDFAVHYARRSGLPDQLATRVTMPYFRNIQSAVWAAVEFGDDAEAWILASELRARLPQLHPRLFASAEVSRLYVDRDPSLEPIWTITVTFGATLDIATE